MTALRFEAIAPILKAHGVRLDGAAQARIERYAALLERWNRRINLVGTQDPHTLWHRHLLDCLLLEAIARDPGLRRWLDAGSGAGLPGVLLAIVHPDWHVALAERVARKATFLREAARTLALDNLVVLREDVHRLADSRGFLPYDGLVARAFAPLPNLLALGCRVLRPGGELWAMKGRRWESEAAQVAPAAMAAYDPHPRTHSYRVADRAAGGEGVVVIYRRRPQASTEA